MIEIVLRKDIAEFEPKPFFGFTARQIMTGVLAGVVSVGAYALMRLSSIFRILLRGTRA